MIRLMVLEWREALRDLRSWIIALLPLLLFSLARVLELRSGAEPFRGEMELFHFGLPALMLQMTLLADLLAHQRVRGELELLRLLPLSSSRLLIGKLGSVILPTAALMGGMVAIATAVLRRIGVSVSVGEAAEAATLLLALIFAYAALGARVALSGGSLRGSIARLFLLLFVMIAAVEAVWIGIPRASFLLVLLLVLSGVAGIISLLKRWNRPETWLAD